MTTNYRIIETSTEPPKEGNLWLKGRILKKWSGTGWVKIGGDSGGTSNYNDLENKPRINGVTLQGDIDGSVLGIESTVEVIDNLTSSDKTKALSANQGKVLNDKIKNIGTSITTITEEVNNKADSATTLAGYGITNAYTKTEANNHISTAVNNAIKQIPIATQSKEGLMSKEDKYKLDGLTGAYIQIVTLANYKAMEAAGTLDENTVYHIKG